MTSSPTSLEFSIGIDRPALSLMPAFAVCHVVMTVVGLDRTTMFLFRSRYRQRVGAMVQSVEDFGKARQAGA